MRISSSIIVKVVNNTTAEQLSEVSGQPTMIIIPRVGEYIEMGLLDNETKQPVNQLFKVIEVSHSYAVGIRNIITLYVNAVKT